MPTGIYQRSPEELERVRKMSSLGHAARRAQRTNFCKRGHERTPENMYESSRSCKACLLERGKVRRKALKGTLGGVTAQRRKSLKRSGWTLEQYEEAFSLQKGLCRLCGFPDPTGTLRADHSHVTRQPRSLLCNKCNTGLGIFQENPELLRKAADYLDGGKK
jgi:hypothetical protein